MSLAVGTIQTPPIRADFDLVMKSRSKCRSSMIRILNEQSVLAGCRDQLKPLPKYTKPAGLLLERFGRRTYRRPRRFRDISWGDLGAQNNSLEDNRKLPRQEGSWYVLALQVRRDASQLNSTGPEIVVQLPHGY